MDVLSLSKLPRVAVITRLILVKTCILQGNFTQRLIRILLRFFFFSNSTAIFIVLVFEGVVVQSLVSLLCQSISVFFSPISSLFDTDSHTKVR